jgi:hypothetical protein
VTSRQDLTPITPVPEPPKVSLSAPSRQRLRPTTTVAEPPKVTLSAPAAPLPKAKRQKTPLPSASNTLVLEHPATPFDARRSSLIPQPRPMYQPPPRRLLYTDTPPAKKQNRLLKWFRGHEPSNKSASNSAPSPVPDQAPASRPTILRPSQFTSRLLVHGTNNLFHRSHWRKQGTP